MRTSPYLRCLCNDGDSGEANADEVHEGNDEELPALFSLAASRIQVQSPAMRFQSISMSQSVRLSPAKQPQPFYVADFLCNDTNIYVVIGSSRVLGLSS